MAKVIDLTGDYTSNKYPSTGLKTKVSTCLHFIFDDPNSKINSFGRTVKRKELSRGCKETKHRSTGLLRKTSHY